MSTSRISIVYNDSCLSCDALHKEMTLVGAMIFCKECYMRIFYDISIAGLGSLDYAVIDKSSVIYQEWMKKHVKRRDQWILSKTL